MFRGSREARGATEVKEWKKFIRTSNRLAKTKKYLCMINAEILLTGKI